MISCRPFPHARRHLLALLAAVSFAAVAVPAAQAAAVTSFKAAGEGFAYAQRAPLMHGVAGDRKFIFVTEPGVDRANGTPRVVALDRLTGRRVGVLPQPPGGFKFPFALRIPRAGRLAVLDNAGFPPSAPPTVQEYDFSAKGGFRARRARTIKFTGLPMVFAEDLEVLPGGRYVVSESVVGGLWIVGRDGKVRPGLVPSNPAAPLTALGPCLWPTGLKVGGKAFDVPGRLAPGAGSMAVQGKRLFFGSSCRGGIHSVRISTLLDRSRSAETRARAIRTVSPLPKGTPAESLKGLSFNRWSRTDRSLYVGDPLRLRLLKIDPRTGRRTVVSADRRLFDFTVSTAFLPPLRGQRNNPLVAIGDQEYRWPVLNTALAEPTFRSSFTVTKVTPGRTAAARAR